MSFEERAAIFGVFQVFGIKTNILWINSKSASDKKRMVWCAVAQCNISSEAKIKNGEKKLGFHTFPKDAVLLKKWLRFCGRGSTFNPETGRVCSAHFEESDFDNYVKFNMGFNNCLRLKKTAVPSILGVGKSKEDSPRKKRNATRERKQLVEELLQNADKQNIIELPNDTAEQANKTAEQTTEAAQQANESAELANALTEARKKIYELTRENVILRKQNTALQRKEAKQTYEISRIENNLKEIFTESQIRKMKNGGRRLIWSEEDVAKSIKLYSISSRAYKFLRDKNFPLPAIRTLHNWSAKSNISPDTTTIKQEPIGVPAAARSSYQNDPFVDSQELPNPLHARRTAVFEASLPQQQQEPIDAFLPFEIEELDTKLLLDNIHTPETFPKS